MGDDTPTREPSMIDRKTIWKPLSVIMGVFVSLVIVMATISGLISGNIYAV